MALGKRLKQLLDERNITVKDFAKSIDVAPTTLYSFIARDSNTGKLELIGKISKGLGIPVTDFLYDSHSSERNINMPTITLDNSNEANWSRIAEYIRRISEMNNKTDKEIVSNVAEIIEPIIASEKQNPPTTLAAHFDGKEHTAEEPTEINEILASTERLLKQDGLMFDGNPASPEAIESILSAMQIGMEMAKKKNREKYTPKKYRKDE